VVERTFGWMTRWRRRVRDYQKRIDVSHAMILVAMGGNLIRRNAHPRFSKHGVIAGGIHPDAGYTAEGRVVVPR